MDLKSLSDEDLRALQKKVYQQFKEYGNKSWSLKILLNGGYGALTNEYNRWYSNELAESITLTGQLASNWVIRDLNAFMNNILRTDGVDYIVAADTDSCYLKVDDIVYKAYGDYDIEGEERFKFLMNLASKIEKVIEESLERLYETLNVAEKSLHMKLESIGSAVWVAKKRYAVSLVANKGIRLVPRKLKVMGLEVQRSSTPEFCRKAIKEVLPLVISGKQREAKELIMKTREEFRKQPFEVIAFPRGVNDIEKWMDMSRSDNLYLLKTPVHVRASIIYNTLVKEKGLENELPIIRSGDKIRYCYLKLPNPTREDIIGAPDTLPEEFELTEFIDYTKQFNKSFFGPIERILNAAGLEYSEDIDITQFFVRDE